MFDNIVVFDVETTGTSYESEITQLSVSLLKCTDAGEMFSCYIPPQRDISKQAEMVTGISKARRSGKTP